MDYLRSNPHSDTWLAVVLLEPISSVYRIEPAMKRPSVDCRPAVRSRAYIRCRRPWRRPQIDLARIGLRRCWSFLMRAQSVAGFQQPLLDMADQETGQEVSACQRP